MKNIIFKTIRAGVIGGVALFAFAPSAFAAPALSPVAVNSLTGTSATLVGHVSNPYTNSTVWIEWSVGSTLSATPNTVGLQTIWGEGSFQWYLSNLTPGQTYTVRSVAMEGGNTVNSQPVLFTTPVAVATEVVTQTQPIAVSVAGTVQTKPVGQTNTETANNTSSTVVAPSKTSTESGTQVNKKTTTVSKDVNPEGFTRVNSNSAAVIGAGGASVFPTTLVGWIILLIALLAMVIVAHIAYEAPIKRKKALVEKKLQELAEQAVLEEKKDEPAIA